MMEKKKAISLVFTLLLIFAVIVVFAQINFHNYIKKQKEADRKQIDLIVSGKLPESLQCVKEIKVENQELLISLDSSVSFRYDKKISENPIVLKSNCGAQPLYSSCTYANNESYYSESLNLEKFDGKNATFSVIATYNGNAKPEIHKRKFTVSDESLPVPK